MGFLDNYEASRERLERWNRTYPTGRIETRIVEFSAEKGYVLVEAAAFRTNEDILPAGIDFAYGYQGAYQQNMKRWFVEDTTTSAIMRVQQLVMGGAERSTREIMEQVETTPAKVANQDIDKDYWTTPFGEQTGDATSLSTAVLEITTKLGAEVMPEAPQCKHGHRVWRESKPGTPKAWGGYFCPQKEKPNQCDPYWYKLSSTGKWASQF
jgi:hypothetical protein